MPTKKSFIPLKKKAQIRSVNKKYYVLDPSFEVTPVKNYRFNKSETRLQSLVDDECFSRNSQSRGKNSQLESMINEMGFEWEPLSEPGHMKQMPYATTITETIEKYSWLVAEQFCNEQDLPIYRISGSELFDANRSEFKKQISIISGKSTLYGTNHYNVVINDKKQILRFSSCTQKLSIAKGLELEREDLPFGLFEISKSYRYEEENELKLCDRTRSFRLPELHVLTDSLTSSLKIALATHIKILQEIKKLDSDYELLCSITYDFFKENMDFLKTICKSIGKPLLLAVYNEGVLCEDGVKIDIEYKVFDILGSPVEFSTFQVDDGTTDSAFNIKYQLKGGSKKPVSTIHIVFNASVERFAYLLLDRAIKKETEVGFKQLPFWTVPIQVRVIAYDKNSLEDSKKLTEKLNSLNFRADLDDREIEYSIKNKEKDLRWIPYTITVDKDNKELQRLSVENKMKGLVRKTMNINDLIKEMLTKQEKNIVVPRYAPMFLSKRLTIK